MVQKRFNTIYGIRLVHGENFLGKLREFAKEQNLTNAIIINGIGMLKNAEIGYYEDGKYIIETIESPVELVSTNGNMFCDIDGKVDWHIHVALAKKSHELVGGHLTGGQVWNTAEIFVQTIPEAKFVKEMEAGSPRLNFK
jgi:hypothetical protein